jgi:hypothetical protein
MAIIIRYFCLRQNLRVTPYKRNPQLFAKMNNSIETQHTVGNQNYRNIIEQELRGNITYVPG